MFPVGFRLQVNMSNNVLVGIGCSEEAIQPLASTIYCKLGRLTFVYPDFLSDQSRGLNRCRILSFWESCLL